MTQRKLISFGIRGFAVIVLLSALMSQPYWYYQCVHWIICGTAIASAVFAYQSKHTPFVWLFIAIAVLFNPIRPFYFHREIWKLLDVLAGIIFGASLCAKHKLRS